MIVPGDAVVPIDPGHQDRRAIREASDTVVLARSSEFRGRIALGSDKLHEPGRDFDALDRELGRKDFEQPALRTGRNAMIGGAALRRLARFRARRRAHIRRAGGFGRRRLR